MTKSERELRELRELVGQLRKEITWYDVEQPVLNDNPTYQRGYKAGLGRALRLIEAALKVPKRGRR